MKIRSLIAAFLLTSAITVVPVSVSAAANVTDAELDSICSVMTPNSVLIQEKQILLSHDEGGAIFSRDVFIPAGVYNIDALSYEGRHPDPADPSDIQDKEQWKVNLFSNGEIVHTTMPTDDIAADLNSNITRIGTEVTLSAPVDTIQYVHLAFGDPVASPNYNSVVPACLSFTDTFTLVDAACTINLVVDTTDTLKYTADLTINDNPATKLTGTINWGDGTDDQIDSLNPMHTYASAGDYTVEVNAVEGENDTLNCEATADITVAGNTVVLGDTDDGDDDGNTVVLGDTDDGSTAVLADTGVSTAALTALAGLALVVATGMLNKVAFSKVNFKLNR